MNNNPFEPVTTDPSIDPPQTDGAADNFTATDNVEVNNTGGIDGPVKAPLSIDGISPSYDNVEKVDDVTLIGSKPDDNRSSTEGAILTDDHAGDFLANLATDDDTPSPDDIVPAASNPPILEPTPTASVKAPSEPKPVKHVTISLLTIIFFILALAGIAGAVWFYMQNSKNADALAESNNKVQQLQDKLADSSTSENTSAGQYDGLNGEIKDLTEKNGALQKTVDEQKTKVDDLTKKNTELTTELTEQTKKATDISNLTTRLDTFLKNSGF